MARLLIIDFDPDTNPFHTDKIWHFGEELHHVLEDDGWGSIPLAEVDAVTVQLKVRVFSKRRVKRICCLIEDLLKKHYLDDKARMTIIVPPDPGTSELRPRQRSA